MSASSFPRIPARQLALFAALLSPLALSVPAFGQGCMATRVTPPILGGPCPPDDRAAQSSFSISAFAASTMRFWMLAGTTS